MQVAGGDFVATANLTSSFSAATVTLELWFKANGPGVLVDERDNPTLTGAGFTDSQLEVVGNQMLAGVRGVAPVVLGTITFGTWHHVALRYDAASQKLDGFLDGVRSATSSTGSRSRPGFEFYTLGNADAVNLGNGNALNGQVDEFRVWNIARSDSQIADNVHAALTGTESGLVAYYHFDEGTGSIAHDSTSNHRDATLAAGFTAPLPTWVASPPLFVPFESPVSVRVADGHDGTDTQNFTLAFTQVTSGAIEGTVFNDANADGNRNPLNVNPPIAPYNLVTVPSLGDPYLAGMPDGTVADPGDAAPAQTPVQVPNLSLVSGSSLMFSAPTGLVQPNIYPLTADFTLPDGINYALQRGFVSHPASLNGVAGITAPPGSVVGVFLGPDRPDLTPAPTALDFQNTVPGGLEYTTLAPLLKQVFFIGDGRTSTGDVQQVVVPSGATRLFLAVMDQAVWSDNKGDFGVDVRPFDASAPEYVKFVSATTISSGTEVDFLEPTNQLVLGVNAPFGSPRNFEAFSPTARMCLSRRRRRSSHRMG